MKPTLLSFAFMLMLHAGMSRTVSSDSSYLGQTPPGNIPEIFAPGIISLENRLETYPTFSPDGNEMFFSVVNAAWTYGKILHTREVNGIWTPVDTAVFSDNGFINWESFISPDGNRQFFASNRPPSLNMDIWMIDRTSDTTWSDPVHIASAVNSNAEDGSACVTSNGTLYFKSRRGGGIGGSWLYRAFPADSSYSEVESLGDLIHTGPQETEPFMAPDESYLIFTSYPRPGGHGDWDLWICFRKADSSWTEPLNMGPTVNTINHEYGPRVSPDGNWLFFTRENRSHTTMDIYWASAGIIDSLKSTVFSPSIPLDSLYLGQPPPGDSAIIFAPGTISLPNRRETKIVFSPDNRECMIGIGTNNTFKVLYTDFYSGYWKTPEPALFIPNGRPIEPFFSPDSLHLFFTNYANILMSTRVNQAWQTPVILPAPVNTGYEEYHPTTSLDGTLYFCSMRENPNLDIYRAPFENGSYSVVEKLDLAVNRHTPEQDGAYDPFIAPDESYILFSCIRPGGYGQADQYISYHRNGSWTNPKNLGPSVNTPAIEYGSYVSPDNKYYFFSRPAGWGPGAAADIYWIKIDGLIDSLRYTNFIPYVRYIVPDQAAIKGEPFNFTLPDSTFTDDDGNNTLTYAAKLADGSPIPAWLSFDTITGTFSGTPEIAETLHVRVTATDTAGAAASTDFKITVNNPVSIEEIDGKRSGLLIFPNPTGGLINLEVGCGEGNYLITAETLRRRETGIDNEFSAPPRLCGKNDAAETVSMTAMVEISNLAGKIIFRDAFRNRMSIDLTSNPKGIYVIRLMAGSEIITGRICLE